MAKAKAKTEEVKAAPELIKWFVQVETLEPATIEAADEDEAREKYRELRGFEWTRNPWRVQRIDEGGEQIVQAETETADEQLGEAVI